MQQDDHTTKDFLPRKFKVFAKAYDAGIATDDDLVDCPMMTW